MRVLVTGIGGFVGSHTAEFLLGIPGIEVHGTVISSEVNRNIDHIASRLDLHEVNILDVRRIDALCSEISPDRIIHLAGQAFVPVSLQDPTTTFHTNILGGLSILDAARKMKEQDGHGPSVLIVSTGEIYGMVDVSRQPISEEFPLRPNNPYAASKASIDLIAQEYRNTFGVNVTVCRPFNHAGPRQSPVFVCSDFGRQFAKIAAGRSPATIRVGNLEACRDFTDVRDVVRAYWSLFDRTSNDVVFNVCSGQAFRIREVLSLFEEITGITVQVISEERRLRSYDVPLVVGSYDRLNRATGWSPCIPLRQTLRDVFAYWQSDVSSTP